MQVYGDKQINNKRSNISLLRGILLTATYLPPGIADLRGIVATANMIVARTAVVGRGAVLIVIG